MNDTLAQEQAAALQRILQNIILDAEENWAPARAAENAEAMIRERARLASTLAIAIERSLKLKREADEQAASEDIAIKEAVRIAEDYRQIRQTIAPVIERLGLRRPVAND